MVPLFSVSLSLSGRCVCLEKCQVPRERGTPLHYSLSACNHFGRNSNSSEFHACVSYMGRCCLHVGGNGRHERDFLIICQHVADMQLLILEGKSLCHSDLEGFKRTKVLISFPTFRGKTNQVFSKPCLFPSDTRHFRHFRRFRGSEERSPCFQWVECKFVIFAVFVKTAPFWQGTKTRFTKNTVCATPKHFLGKKWPEFRRKRDLCEPLLTAMAQVLPSLIMLCESAKLLFMLGTGKTQPET